MTPSSALARSRHSATLAALVSAVLAAAAPAFAVFPCGPANPVNWCVHQDTAGVAEFTDPDDHFGAALAFGDFNDDGFDDFAVGIPGEDGKGAVDVFRGSAAGLVLTGQLFFTQDDLPGDDGNAENGDEFGATLAVGDFNEDGVDDLVIASPGEDLASAGCGITCLEAGAIHVVYGAPGTGLQLASADFIQAMDINGGNDQRGRFGTALAVGRLPDAGGDSNDDLLIGSPFADASFDPEMGFVRVAFGSPQGLNQDGGGGVRMAPAGGCEANREHFGAAIAAGRLMSSPDDQFVVAEPNCKLEGLNAVGRAEFRPTYFSSSFDTLVQTEYSTAGNGEDDAFGSAIAIGNFDDDAFDDVAIAAPFKNHGSGNPSDSGRVYVAYGTSDGPDPSDGPDIIGEDEWASSGDAPGAGERFGTGLAAGDVTDDGFEDLIAGAPGEGTSDVGRVYVKRGGPNGLTTVSNILFTQTALGGQNGTDDHLGTVFALGDVNGDGALELALGVPDKDVGADGDAGMVYVTQTLHLLLDDGFESGNTLAWTSVTP
jgi:hypothetical protein